MDTCAVLQTAGSWCDLESSLCAAKGIQGRPKDDALPVTRLRGDDGRIVSWSYHKRTANDRSPLLSLPPELRRQIYGWVLLMTPVRNGSPDPAYPAPEIRRCELRCLAEDEDVNDDDETVRGRRPPRLLCPDRPLCGMPTSLLRSCRQVYVEARLMPFEENEFVFVTWFASGLVTGHATVTGLLRPWQRRAMRYARIEMLGHELQDEVALRTWTALSEAWAGLRGLRVRIAGPAGGALDDVLSTETSEKQDADGGAERSESDWEPVRRVAENWAEKGALASMGDLERLEVELAVPAWSTRTKLEFCVALERRLKLGGSSAVVVCTTSGVAGHASR
ncbi:hypothetical protein VFPFJ_08980 [Purpureocillium lilacinum]|uniref:DUF7730 domain-containing protein n=1 Tax=Purpureocillium lilacinum TaxID=33203 RepID=A0A179GYW8_PURLI|nr:hypothetical protein VFPFJ_08980 [Purpureocillium lilacinum]OAQ83177.1 hypothetical protein VFPFJ_08980 [Purpureocillium lilacinum]